ncbi:MAG: hypothetical protein R6U61_03345 [Thermoplasmata archaeon]
MIEQKVKVISVWLIALVLIVGTALAIGLWMLRMNPPVEYEEYGGSFILEYTDERDYRDWEVVSSFPYEQDRERMDLTYRTFHNYFRLHYDGRDPLRLNATISAHVNNDFRLEHIGFALFEGIAEPGEITWSNNTAQYDGQEVTIHWAYYSEEILIDTNGTYEYTLINILSEDAPPYTESNGLHIMWDFYRDERATGGLITDQLLASDRNVYDVTPILLSVSLIVTFIVGYSLIIQKGERR